MGTIFVRPNTSPKNTKSGYKMRSLIASLLFICCAFLAHAQTARVQIIHNAPDPTVDIYVNGLLAFDNAAFQQASPFTTVPAGLPLEVAVAPSNSVSALEAVFKDTLVFESGKTYAVYALGVIFGNPPFELLVQETREASGNPAKVDFTFLQGSPNAPTLELSIFEGPTIAPSLNYGQTSAFASVDTGKTYFQLRQTGTNVLLGTWLADWGAFGGKALRVFVSGFYNGAPAFGLFAALPDGRVVPLPATPSPPVYARVQIIHNSSAGTPFDVYINDAKITDNLPYRQATPFTEIRKGAYNLAFAPANSTSVNEAFTTLVVNLLPGQSYVIMGAGLPGDPTTPFTVAINDRAKEQAPFPFGVDLSFAHGVTGGPDYDIDGLYYGSDLVDKLPFGQFSNYVALGPEPYDFAVRPHDATQAVAIYRMDLAPIIGKTAHLFLSGDADGSPALGLYAAFHDGTVLALSAMPTAPVQILHNAIDPTIDLYTGDTKVADDLEYRHATPYLTFPADRSLSFGVAGAGSSSVFDVLFRFNHIFDKDQSYTLAAYGIVFDTVYPLSFAQAPAKTKAAAADRVELSLFHGSPGLGALDVAVYGGGNLFSNIGYGAFSDYQSLKPGTYYVQLKPAGLSSLLKTYEVALDTLVGAAIRLFVSGRPNDLRLFGAFPDGRTVEFPTGSAAPAARAQLIQNCPNMAFDIYFDNALVADNFEFREATPFLDIAAGRDVEVTLAPSTSISPAQSLARFNLRFGEGKTYVITALGTLGGTPPLSLLVNDKGLELAPDTNRVVFSVQHGVANAPAVDVDALFVADNLFSNLGYGQYSDYIDLAPDLYDLAIRPHGSPLAVATYRADLRPLRGQAATVFAGGILNGVPAFGLYAALADGTVVTLPSTPMARVQFLHNAPNATIDVYAGNTRLLDDFQYLKATPFRNLPAGRAITLGIAPDNSASATAASVFFNLNLEAGKAYIAAAIGVFGGTPSLDFALNPNALENASSTGKVSVSMLHGAVGAPVVDVDALFVASNLVTGLGYAQYAPYATLEPAIQDFSIRAAGNPDVLGNFRADLAAFVDQALCVFAGQGAGGAGLYLLLRDGTVLPLSTAPVARLQLIHNAPEAAVDVYGGTQRLSNDLAYRGATPFLLVPAERAVALKVAGATTPTAASAFIDFNRNFAAGKTYVALLGGQGTALEIFLDDQGRESATNPNLFDVRYFNGVPDAGSVEVVAYSGDVSFSGVTYGNFTPYLSVAAKPHQVSINAGTNTETVVVEGLAGRAGTVFSTGFLNGTPAFRSWMALADGNTYPLPTFVGTGDVAQAVSNLEIWPNPAHDILWVSAELSSGVSEVQYAVRDLYGRVLETGVWGNVQGQTLDVSRLVPGVYVLELRMGEKATVARFVKGE